MPQMDHTTFFSIFETLMVTFIFGYALLSTHLLLPFINIMKIRYELKTRLLFINFLIVRKLKELNSFNNLKEIKINYPCYSKDYN
jgi:hypothetical protein